MNPFSFFTGLLGNFFGSSTSGNITFTPAQAQAIVKAIEAFAPMIAGVSPAQLTVAENLLTAFGYGSLIPPVA